MSNKKELYDSTSSWGLTPGGSSSAEQVPLAVNAARSGTTSGVHPDGPSEFESYLKHAVLASWTVKQGSAGDDVQWIQSRLNLLPDGLYRSRDAFIHARAVVNGKDKRELIAGYATQWLKVLQNPAPPPPGAKPRNAV